MGCFPCRNNKRQQIVIELNAISQLLITLCGAEAVEIDFVAKGQDYLLNNGAVTVQKRNPKQSPLYSDIINSETLQFLEALTDSKDLKTVELQQGKTKTKLYVHDGQCILAVKAVFSSTEIPKFPVAVDDKINKLFELR